MSRKLDYKAKSICLNVNEALYKQARQSGLDNTSQYFNRCLEQFLGLDSSHPKLQLQQIDTEIQQTKARLSALSERKQQVQTQLEHYDQQVEQEQELFNTFLKECNLKLKQVIDIGADLNYTDVARQWHKKYFPNNGIDRATVIGLLNKVNEDSFGIHHFIKIRNGNKNVEGKNC